MAVSVFVDKNKLELAEVEALSDKAAVCKTRQIASISAHYAISRDRGTRGTVTASLLYMYVVCTVHRSLVFSVKYNMPHSNKGYISIY